MYPLWPSPKQFNIMLVLLPNQCSKSQCSLISFVTIPQTDFFNPSEFESNYIVSSYYSYNRWQIVRIQITSVNANNLLRIIYCHVPMNNNNNNNNSSRKPWKSEKSNWPMEEKFYLRWKKDALSSLLLVIAMKQLQYIYRKCTYSNKFTKSQEKNNHLWYIDDINLFAKNEKEL